MKGTAPAAAVALVGTVAAADRATVTDHAGCLREYGKVPVTVQERAWSSPIRDAPNPTSAVRGVRLCVFNDLSL